MEDKDRKKTLKLFQKGLKLFRDEKFEKSYDLFRDAGYLANKIKDREIEKDCIEYMEKCMIKLQEKIDKEKKEIENSFSQLYG
ncbi:MAG: hypothetical protein ACTSPY_01045 [Candidatus Helarchaeota archaeon]